MFKNTENLQDSEIALKLTATCEEQPEKHWLPAYYFDICLLDGTAIGNCDLRIGHNEKTYIGGNIGYRIEEPFRGHNYAAKACKLLFKLAKEHSMDYLIITCDVNNIASYKTCEKCGGTFIEIADVPEDNELYLDGQRKTRVYRVELLMKQLFVLDEKNYTDDMKVLERFAVRCVICKNGRYAMQLGKDGDYKLPGGGIEAGEGNLEALSREVQEETGLVLKLDAAKEIGEVVEIRKDIYDEKVKYICHSYIYTCDVEDETVATNMSEKEKQRGLHLVWEDIDKIISVNNKEENYEWALRDTMILEYVIKQSKLN